MTDNKITVVIPNYNGIKYLPDCLDSLLDEKKVFPDFSILVVDNGSSDGSDKVLLDDYPQVEHIMLSENTGFCHGVNVGIEAAQTPYVILLNNDTKVKTGFIKSLYESIESKPDAFSVSSKMLMWDRPELVDDAGDRYCVFGWAYGRGKGKHKDLYNQPTEVFASCGGAAIYRKSVFGEIGLFDELHFAYLEDIDVGYRAKIFGYKNYYEPEAEVLHYGSASTGSRYNEWKTKMAAENNVYLLVKNMPFLQKLINLPFLMIGFFVKYLFFIRKRMGKIYIKGLFSGLKKGYGKAGRRHRVSFRFKHFGAYCKIQLELYINTLKFLKKS